MVHTSRQHVSEGASSDLAPGVSGVVHSAGRRGGGSSPHKPSFQLAYGATLGRGSLVESPKGKEMPVAGGRSPQRGETLPRGGGPSVLRLRLGHLGLEHCSVGRGPSGQTEGQTPRRVSHRPEAGRASNSVPPSLGLGGGPGRAGPGAAEGPTAPQQAGARSEGTGRSR